MNVDLSPYPFSTPTPTPTPTHLSLCSGIGGMDIGIRAAGFRTLCYIERHPYRQQVLQARIRDGSLDDAPIWDDATTFDGIPWRGRITLLSGGIPCQPFSTGGHMRGEADSRYLWPTMLRLICEMGPHYILLENVPGILMGRADRRTAAPIGRILGQLSDIGYDAEWTVLSAAGCGLPHRRNRLFVVAYPRQERRTLVLRRDLLHRLQADYRGAWSPPDPLGTVWDTLAWMEERVGEPSVCREDDGVAYRVERLSAIGESVVPQLAYTLARCIIMERKERET